MELNKLTISKNNDRTCKIALNGMILHQVIDFNYSKKSAKEPVEVTLKFDADEVVEVYDLL